MNYLDKTGLTQVWNKVTTKLSQKQDTLVSGTNIKTINNTSLLGSGNINIDTISVKHIDTTNNTEWDSEHDQPTQAMLQDIATHIYQMMILDNIDLGEDTIINVCLYLGAQLDNDTMHVRQYVRFEEGDEEDNEPAAMENWLIGNYDEENPTTYLCTKQSTTIVKRVEINGSSVLEGSVANIVTEGAYNASSNKIATMSDIENTVDLSSYSINDTISDATLVAKLKKDGVIVTNNGSKYRLATHDSNQGMYLYTVMNQLDGGDYIILNESGNNLIVSIKDSAYWQTKIDSSNKLSADLVTDSSTTNKFVTTSEKTTWNAKYDKPAGGIPSTDLASAVQTSLGKADSALQTHQSIKTINNTTMVGTGNISVQPTLVSGTNIKTVNNNSLLGTGNLSLVEGAVVVSNTEPSDPDVEVWIDTSEPGVIESKFKNKTWHSKAHRGNIVGHEATLRENTLGAYHNAFIKGANVIEIDARLSSDSVFMCNHDATVTDINGDTYTIANETSTTLQNLVLSTGDSTYGSQGVPTLESVLKLAYTCGMKVDIDLKMFDTGMTDTQKRTFASNVAKLVAKCGMKSRVTYAIQNAGALVIPEIIAIDPEASFVAQKTQLDAISNLSSILPNYKDKCYAYTSDLTASTINAIRDAGYRLELISIDDTNFNTAIQFYPDNMEYLHTTDFRTIEDAYFNSVTLY